MPESRQVRIEPEFGNVDQSLGSADLLRRPIGPISNTVTRSLDVSGLLPSGEAAVPEEATLPEWSEHSEDLGGTPSVSGSFVIAEPFALIGDLFEVVEVHACSIFASGEALADGSITVYWCAPVAAMGVHIFAYHRMAF